MKNLSITMGKLALIATIALLASCKKFDQTAVITDDAKQSVSAISYANQSIFTPAQHNFTDIQICYDDKVFLLEDGKLKRLIGNDLVDVNLPASIYTDFHPTYLTISKDFTFYLRSSTGIKVIKGGKLVKEYKVGQGPLQDFTPETFGERSLSVDESDESLIVGYIRLYNPELTSLLKITKSGEAMEIIKDENQTDGAFYTAFEVGGKPGQIWLATLRAFVDFYYSSLLQYSVGATPFDYRVVNSYGVQAGNHSPFPIEGAVDSVGFGLISGVEVSKDGKLVFLKFGSDVLPGNVTDAEGYVLRIKNNIVERIAENIPNNRMAISNDGKTLYLAGKGLSKIEL